MLSPARTTADAARNREILRKSLSALLKRELTEQEAVELALRGVEVLEQVEREKKRDK